MKAFIWNTEYTYFIAVSDTKEEAIKILLEKYPEYTEESGFDERDEYVYNYHNSLSDLLHNTEPLVFSSGLH
jgi:hypothetical protein